MPRGLGWKGSKRSKGEGGGSWFVILRLGYYG